MILFVVVIGKQNSGRDEQLFNITYCLIYVMYIQKRIQICGMAISSYFAVNTL